MESVYLKTLVEVVKAGSLSKAADVLCVTQPAVSRRIKFLEDQYGCDLLDRSGPGLRPTEAGRLVFEKAETLLAIEADLVSGLKRLDGKTRISFGSTPSFGISHLPAILREFMLTCAETADLKFAFHAPEQILDGLHEGEFDLAVMEVCDCFDLSGYTTVSLPGDEMVFVSAPALDLPVPDVTLEALVDLPLFARREGCCSRIMLETNLESIGASLQRFQKTIVVDDLHIVVQAVLDGEGVSYLSRDVVAEQLASGRLRPHYVRGFRRTRQRALVLQRPEPLVGPIEAFVAALFGHFSLAVPAGLRTASSPTPPSPAVPRCLTTAS